MSDYQELKGHHDLKVYQLAHEEVGPMPGKMMSMPEKFIPTNQHHTE